MRITAHFNRLITIKRMSEETDNIGARRKAYTPVRDLHANVMVRNGREAYANEMYLNHEFINFKIRFIDDILHTDLIEYNGHDYQITSIDEIGRRSELILTTYRKLNG